MADYLNFPSLEEIQAALTECHGNKSAAARMLSVRRTNLVERINAHPELLLHCREVIDDLVDKAEENIYSSVYAGDEKSSRFVLQTIGKDRGYTTRQENTGPNGGAIPFAGDINVNFISAEKPLEAEDTE